MDPQDPLAAKCSPVAAEVRWEHVWLETCLQASPRKLSFRTADTRGPGRRREIRSRDT